VSSGHSLGASRHGVGVARTWYWCHWDVVSASLGGGVGVGIIRRPHCGHSRVACLTVILETLTRHDTICKGEEQQVDGECTNRKSTRMKQLQVGQIYHWLISWSRAPSSDIESKSAHGVCVGNPHVVGSRVGGTMRAKLACERARSQDQDRVKERKTVACGGKEIKLRTEITLLMGKKNGCYKRRSVDNP